MDISERLRCVFSAEIEEQSDSYTITIPDSEIETGNLEAGAVYRAAILTTATETQATQTPVSDDTDDTQTQEPSEPPVHEGATRKVTIEDIGEQGDGIARVERGYVVIVPETEMGAEVTIEITDTRENVAFGEVIER